MLLNRQCVRHTHSNKLKSRIKLVSLAILVAFLIAPVVSRSQNTNRRHAKEPVFGGERNSQVHRNNDYSRSGVDVKDKKRHHHYLHHPGPTEEHNNNNKQGARGKLSFAQAADEFRALEEKTRTELKSKPSGANIHHTKTQSNCKKKSQAHHSDKHLADELREPRYVEDAGNPKKDRIKTSLTRREKRNRQEDYATSWIHVALSLLAVLIIQGLSMYSIYYNESFHTSDRANESEREVTSTVRVTDNRNMKTLTDDRTVTPVQQQRSSTTLHNEDIGDFVDWDPCMEWCDDLRRLTQIEQLIDGVGISVVDVEMAPAESISSSIMRLSAECQSAIDPNLLSSVSSQAHDLIHIDGINTRDSITSAIAGSPANDEIDELVEQYIFVESKSNGASKGTDDDTGHAHSNSELKKDQDSDGETTQAAPVNTTDSGSDVNAPINTTGSSSDANAPVNTTESATDTSDGGETSTSHGRDLVTHVQQDSQQPRAPKLFESIHNAQDDIVQIRTLLEDAMTNKKVNETELCTVALNIVESQRRQSVAERASIFELHGRRQQAWREETETASHHQLLMQEQRVADRNKLKRDLAMKKTELMQKILKEEHMRTEALVLEFTQAKCQIDCEAMEIQGFWIWVTVMLFLAIAALVVFGATFRAGAGAGATVGSFTYHTYKFIYLGKLAGIFLLQGVLPRLGLPYIGSSVLACFLAARYIFWTSLNCLFPGVCWSLAALSICMAWYSVFIPWTTQRQITVARQRLEKCTSTTSAKHSGTSSTTNTEGNAANQQQRVLMALQNFRQDEDIFRAFAWEVPGLNPSEVDVRMVMNHAVMPWFITIVNMLGLYSITNTCSAV